MHLVRELKDSGNLGFRVDNASLVNNVGVVLVCRHRGVWAGSWAGTRTRAWIVASSESDSEDDSNEGHNGNSDDPELVFLGFFTAAIFLVRSHVWLVSGEYLVSGPAGSILVVNKFFIRCHNIYLYTIYSPG